MIVLPPRIAVAAASGKGRAPGLVGINGGVISGHGSFSGSSGIEGMACLSAGRLALAAISRSTVHVRDGQFRSRFFLKSTAFALGICSDRHSCLSWYRPGGQY